MYPLGPPAKPGADLGETGPFVEPYLAVAMGRGAQFHQPAPGGNSVVKREAENIHTYPGAPGVGFYEHFLDDGVASASPDGLEERHGANGADLFFRFSKDDKSGVSVGNKVVKDGRDLFRFRRGSSKFGQQIADESHRLRLIGRGSEPDVQQIRILPNGVRASD